jgi:hypothetical protein
MADCEDDSSRCYIDEATGISAFKIFKLGKTGLEDCFPCEPDQRDWYGVYYRCGKCFSMEGAPVGERSSLVLLKGDFEWVRRQLPVHQRDVLILFRRDFLSGEVERKLNRLPLFLQQGLGPFQLDDPQSAELQWIIDRTWIELASRYRFKRELLTSLLLQVVHFVIKHFTAGCCDGSKRCG